MMHCGFAGFLWVVGAMTLARMLFRAFGRRHRHHPHCGGGGGGGGCGARHEHAAWDERHDAWQGYGRRGGWGARKLGWIFQGLETTPEQERVLFETLGELKSAGRAIAGKVASARGQWADALEAESFDETMVGGAVADLESAVDDARKTAIDAFAKVHGALDATQRKRLADSLRKRRGPFAGFAR